LNGRTARTKTSNDADGRHLRIAAVGDFHCGGAHEPTDLAATFAEISEQADVLLLMGDLTTHGEPEQIERFLRYVDGVSIPMLTVLGNHDMESDKTERLCELLAKADIRVLDGDAVEIEGVGFAGTKGFGGGFGRHALGTFGEPETKAFVDAALQEALKLERALAELRAETKVVLLHYSPIEATMGDEPPQIWPFLGSSRLAGPIDAFGAAVAFHGHAHIGAPEGETPGGVPVFNVALPVLQKLGMKWRLWTTAVADRRATSADTGGDGAPT
jgi:Icc-related predicted phosphoesterase